MANLPDMPVANSLIQGEPEKPGQKPKIINGFITFIWIEFFLALLTRLTQTPQQVAPVVTTTPQSAAILTTPIPSGQLAAAQWRVTYYIRITQASSVSSSAQVTIGWMDGGIACTFVGAALTANTTSTTESKSVLVRSDAASAITYSVAYSSVGAPIMTYSLLVTSEAMS